MFTTWPSVSDISEHVYNKKYIGKTIGLLQKQLNVNMQTSNTLTEDSKQ